MKLEEAIDKAIDEMESDSLIKPLLVANRSEVKMSILTEYDENKVMQMFKEEGREEGAAERKKLEARIKDLEEQLKKVNIAVL